MGGAAFSPHDLAFYVGTDAGEVRACAVVSMSHLICIRVCSPTPPIQLRNKKNKHYPPPPHTHPPFQQLLALDAASGRLLWSYTAMGPITTPPSVVPPLGGLVLATTGNGLLTAIRALPAGQERCVRAFFPVCCCVCACVFARLVAW